MPVTGTGAGGTSPSAPASPAQHSSPPALGFTSFIQDVFFPASGSTVVETTTTSPSAQPLSATSAGVLFGSGAVSATTGLAAYYLQKKKEEEEARREAILAKIAAEKAAEERRERIAERIRQQEAIAAAKAAKNAPVVYASVATTQAKAQTQMQTKVVYMREKEDPVLANYTGKPSMSMSDALKITHPQTKSTTKTKTVYNREKYDTYFERKTETGKTWNAKDGVISISTSKTGKDLGSILGGIRDDVCYAPGYGNDKKDPTDPLGIKTDDVCYAPAANNGNKGSTDGSGEKRDDVCYVSDYGNDKEKDPLLIPFSDTFSKSSTLGNKTIQYPPFIKYGPYLPEPTHSEEINPESSQPFGLEQYNITMGIVKSHHLKTQSELPVVEFPTELVELAKQLPSTEVFSFPSVPDNQKPFINLGIIKVGHEKGCSLATNTESNLYMKYNGLELTQGKGGPFATGFDLQDGVSWKIKALSTIYKSDGFEGIGGVSITETTNSLWENGGNTTTKISVNIVDITVNKGPASANVYSGFYLEYKPIQLAALYAIPYLVFLGIVLFTAPEVGFGFAPGLIR